MEAIRIWLNSKRDYKKGVSLYALYGRDILLKRMFLEPESDHKRIRLQQELQRIFDESKASAPAILPSRTKPVVIMPAANVQEKKPVYADSGWSKEPDATEAALHARFKPLFVTLMDLTSSLGRIAREGVIDPAKEKEAGVMAFRILEIDKQLSQIYEERDYYFKHGNQKVIYPYGEPCIDPNLIPLKLQNAQRLAREQRTKLDKDPLNKKAADLLKKHQWFIDHYKSVLNK